MAEVIITTEDNNRIEKLLERFDSFAMNQLKYSVRYTMTEEERSYIVSTLRKEAADKLRAALVMNAVILRFADDGIGTPETRAELRWANGTIHELFTSWSDPRISELQERCSASDEEKERVHALVVEMMSDFDKGPEKRLPTAEERNEAFHEASERFKDEKIRKAGLWHAYSAEGSLQSTLENIQSYIDQICDGTVLV